MRKYMTFNLLRMGTWRGKLLSKKQYLPTEELIYQVPFSLDLFLQNEEGKPSIKIVKEGFSLDRFFADELE